MTQKAVDQTYSAAGVRKLKKRSLRDQSLWTRLLQFGFRSSSLAKVSVVANTLHVELDLLLDAAFDALWMWYRHSTSNICSPFL